MISKNLLWTLGAMFLLVLASNLSLAAPNITVNSPLELESGEEVFLDIMSNETIYLNYSLDSGPIVNLGNGTSFVRQINGTLDYGMFSNGNHAIEVFTRDIFGIESSFEHSFDVDDIVAPTITLNMSNSSRHNGTSQTIIINLTSNEYSTVKYKINSNSFSAPTTLAKSSVFAISVYEGQNNLTINTSDYHNNSKATLYTFNYSLVQLPSCSDAIQNGAETGIDCGGTCSSCVAFTVTTDKVQYNLTGSVYLNVLSRANSTANITVKKGGDVSYRHTFVPVFSGAPISEQRVISNTSNAGNYTVFAVMKYLNISESLNFTFEVLAPSQNTLSVTISANATTIDENSPIKFTSTVSGNAAAVTYKWDFKNDGSIDSTETEPVFVYTSNGTFTVNLTVSDGIWNQTDIETINSKKLYNITVHVRDNSTGSNIQNAEIEINEVIANTSSEGTVVFSLREDSHTIIAKKPGYTTFSNKTSIKQGPATIEIYLVEQDTNSPQIILISPQNEATTSDKSISFKYIVSDKNQLRCSIFLNKDSGGWIKSGNDFFVNPNIEANFTVDVISNASYEWQIECFDRFGNKNSSEIWKFDSRITEVEENSLSVSLDEQDLMAQDLESQIEEAISYIKTYTQDEKEASEAMQLQKLLEKAKIELQRANRDLHSLVWRKLNETELEKETNTILEKIENLKKETPKGIIVSEKTEFVKYPTKQDIEFALQPLIAKTNLKLSKKDIKALVDAGFRIQNLITVTTKAKLIEVEYLAGNNEKITLIHKIVESEEGAEKYGFYEVIPKEIADDAEKIISQTPFEIVQKDPIIKIDAIKEKEFAYFIKGELDLADAENIRSILLEEKIRRQESGFLTGLVTGFVPTEGVAGTLLKTSNIRLVLELAVIIVLGLVFAYYQIGGYDKLELVFNSKLSHLMKEFEYLSVRISNYLDGGKYEESKVLYNEMNQLYRQMPTKMRSKMLPKMLELHAKMDFIFMDNSLNIAFASINEGDAKKALHIYNTITGLYKSLPKDYKAQIHSKCMELHSKLNH